MSNHYYADGAIHNDHHKELNINGNISTEQLVQITKSFLMDEVDEKPKQQNTSSGARKQFLFIDGRTTEENVGVKNLEKERFLGYLSEHKMSGRRLVTEKKDGLNKAVVCFLKLWRENGLTAKLQSGGAVFRFLTEDCGLKTDVTEASYSNKIKEWMRGNDYDVTTYQGVKTFFNTKAGG